jgi:hypothetical protein
MCWPSGSSHGKRAMSSSALTPTSVEFASPSRSLTPRPRHKSSTSALGRTNRAGNGSPRRSARLACAPPRLGSPAGSPRPVWRAAIRSNRNSAQSTPSTTSSAHKDAGAERHRSYDDGLAVHDQPASSRALTSGPAGEAHAARGQNRRRSSPHGRFARRAERARRLFRPAETSDDLLPLQPPWFHGRHLAGLHPVLVLSAPSLTGGVPYRARGPNAADRNRIRDQGKSCSESESSINGSIPTAYWSSCKPMPEKKRRFPAFCRALWRTRTADPLVTIPRDWVKPFP